MKMAQVGVARNCALCILQCVHILYVSIYYFFPSQGRVREWCLIDRLSQALILLVSVLLN